MAPSFVLCIKEFDLYYTREIIGLVLLFVISFTFLRSRSLAAKSVLLLENDAPPPATGQGKSSSKVNGRKRNTSNDISNDMVPLDEGSDAKQESFETNRQTTTTDASRDANAKEPPTLDSINDGNNWRCACEGGFLPPGLLKTFGGAEAVMRLGSGQCYHKQV